MSPKASILIACSGLGRIRRGNEAWAFDVATALHQAGVSVSLAGGGPQPGVDCPYSRLLAVPRDFPILRRVVSWSRRYLLEQLTFLLSLRSHVRQNRPGIVHLCDPDLALQFVKRTRGWPVRTIFKDGMLLGPHWCRRMPCVQVLAPYYRDVLARQEGVDTRTWFVIPHLVDTTRYQPVSDPAAARAVRSRLDLPAGALVMLGVGDYSAGGNKRLDWLMREVAAMPAALNAHLLLVGQAGPEEFQRFESTARSILGSRVRLLRNRPREEVAGLYQAADIFVHAATREPFGIVFLEAMASGLPLMGHPWEVTRWIIGDAGETVDMTEPGALAARLRHWGEQPALRAEISTRARQRAVSLFSPQSLVPRYQEMYAKMVES